jgi:hypothetical protein
VLVGKRLGGRLERVPTAGRVIVLFDAFWTLILHVRNSFDPVRLLERRK